MWPSSSFENSQCKLSLASLTKLAEKKAFFGKKQQKNKQKEWKKSNACKLLAPPLREFVENTMLRQNSASKQCWTEQKKNANFLCPNENNASANEIRVQMKIILRQMK